jgi:hypothetical protein
MKTTSINIYTFDELNDNAKEVARDWYRENIDYTFLSEYMHDEASILLSEVGITTDEYEVFCSLAYCQGDGAMVELTGKWGKYEVVVKHNGHYYHERSTSITLTDKDGEEVDCTEFEEEVYIPMCKKLAKAGYAYIKSENSDETVDENIRANEYDFLESGKRPVLA